MRRGERASRAPCNIPPLRGHVESISRGITDRDNAAGPELLANVNPTFEWVRLAQRIPVHIHIDDVPPGVLISSGMTCDRGARRAAASLGDRRNLPRRTVTGFSAYLALG
jgi:multidrug resistance efflux pump